MKIGPAATRHAASGAATLRIRTAETPADWRIAMESHHGTVYKVTNWTCAGDTKGFSQDQTGYYLPNGRPKKLIPATGKKEDSEAGEARVLLADPQVRLENALVTADPLHHKEPTLRAIVEKGGDYLVGTKGNTANRFEAVEKAPADTPFST